MTSPICSSSSLRNLLSADMYLACPLDIRTTLPDAQQNCALVFGNFKCAAANENGGIASKWFSLGQCKYAKRHFPSPHPPNPSKTRSNGTLPGHDTSVSLPVLFFSKSTNNHYVYVLLSCAFVFFSRSINHHDVLFLNAFVRCQSPYQKSLNLTRNN